MIVDSYSSRRTGQLRRGGLGWEDYAHGGIIHTGFGGAVFREQGIRIIFFEIIRIIYGQLAGYLVVAQTVTFSVSHDEILRS
jgi:hypothetical protein